VPLLRQAAFPLSSKESSYQGRIQFKDGFWRDEILLFSVLGGHDYLHFCEKLKIINEGGEW
jgi:hypothetical protein